MIYNSKGKIMSQIFSVAESGSLKTNQNSKIDFDSLFFKQKVNKKISNKESFYQYLLINSNFSNNLLKTIIFSKENLDMNKLKKEIPFIIPASSNLMNQNDKTMTLKNDSDFSLLKTSLNSLLKIKSSTHSRSSEILENLNITNSLIIKPDDHNFITNKLGPNNSQKLTKSAFSGRFKSNSFFFQDQIFITYKKSFLCYWLLPLLGLAGTASSSLLNSPSLDLIPTTKDVLGMYLIKTTQNKISSEKLIKEDLNSEFYDFSLLLSKSNLSQNKTTLKMLEKNERSQKVSQLLLNDLIRIRPELLKMNLGLADSTSPINFAGLNFALLNNKLKKQSNFKWYWFNLFFKNVPNEGSNQHFSIPDPSLNGTNESPILNFYPKDPTSPFFPTKLLTFENQFRQVEPIPLKGSNSLNLKGESKPNFTKLKNNKLSTNKGNQEVSQLHHFLKGDQPFLSKYGYQADLNKNQFLLGIINKKNYRELKVNNLKTIEKSSTKQNKPVSTNLLGPYKSFKKMYFLMNKLNLLETNFFNSEVLWSDSLSTPKIVSNFGLKNTELSQNETIKSNLSNDELLLKNLNLKKTLIILFTKKQTSTCLATQPLLLGEGALKGKKTFVNSMKNNISEVDTDILCGYIYDNLVDNLNLILDNKFQKNKKTPQVTNFNITKTGFINPFQQSLREKLLKNRYSSRNNWSNMLLKKSNSDFSFKNSHPAIVVQNGNLKLLKPLNAINIKNFEIGSNVYRNSDQNQKTVSDPFIPIEKKLFLNLFSRSLNNEFDGLVKTSFEKDLNLKTQNSNTLKFSVLTLSNSIRGGSLPFSNFLNTGKEEDRKEKNFKITTSKTTMSENINRNIASSLLESSVNSLENNRSFSKISINKENDQKMRNQLKNPLLRVSQTKNEKNDFLMLSKYANLLTNTIKVSLSPYKHRLNYLPEMKITKFNLNTNSIKKRQKLAEKDFKLEKPKLFRLEKIFMSYLSQSKTNSTLKSSAISNDSFLKKTTLSSDNFILNTSENRQLLKLKSRGEIQKIPFLKNSNINKSNENLKISKTKDKKIRISPLLTVKNRLFIHKLGLELKLNNSKKMRSLNKVSNQAISKNQNLLSPIGEPTTFFNFEKNQSSKVKRRLKKMKCETRRRKKRKIFYPRPIWITFNLYQKFLNARLYDKVNLKTFDFKQTAKSPWFDQNSQNPKVVIYKNLNSSKNYFKTNSLRSSKSSQHGFYSHWLNEKQIKTDYFYKASFKTTKDFYGISKSVSANLRQVLMKSNWLRSYLNPYLSKVKMILKGIQNSSKNLQIYTSLRSLLLGFYGSDSTLVLNSLTPNNGLNVDLSSKEFSKSSLSDLNQPWSAFYLNTKDYICEAQNQFDFLPKDSNSIHSFWSDARISSKKTTPYNNKSSMVENKTAFARSSTIDMLEYNRIIYQRLQRVILNIRDNLNLNGQFKSKSKNLGRNIRPFIKRDYTKRDLNNGMPVNQNAILWSKILKNNVLKFTRSFFNSSYDESSPYINVSEQFSRNKFYWALNKSSALINTNFNSSFSKKLWETYKVREISKKNQTKKIIFNLFMKYTSLFKPTSSIFQYNNVLNSTFVQKNQEENVNASNEDTKFSRFFSKKIGVFDRSLNLNSNFLDDQISKNIFTLPPKTYTSKTEQKLIRIENKLKLLGLYSKKIDYNYKTSYFRFLKNELLKEKSFYYNSLVPSSGLSGSQGIGAAANSFISEEKAIETGLDCVNSTLKGTNLNILQRAMLFSSGKYISRMDNQILFTDNPLFKTDYYSLASQTKLANNNSYWWSFLKMNTSYEPKPEFTFQMLKTTKIKKSSLDVGYTTNLTGLSVASFLFHFCALVSFISLGGIRTLIKFYFMVISKLSKAIGDLEKLSKILPKKSFSEKNISFFETSSTYSTVINDNQNWSEPLNRLKKRSKGKVNLELFSTLFMAKQSNSKQSTTIVLKTLKLSFLKYLTARSTFNSSSQFQPNFNVQKTQPKNTFINPNVFKDLLHKTEGLEKSHNFNGFSSEKRRSDTDTNGNFSNSDSKLIDSRTLFKLILDKKDLRDKGLYLNKLKLFYFSFLKLSVLIRFGHKISFYSYLLVLKSVDLLAIPASFIYKFFEKPGEYVVENLAYSFLVEWSADLISTVPETVDMVQAQYFVKLNRYNSLILLQSAFNPLYRSNLSFESLQKPVESFFQNSLLFMLTHTALKRVLNASFLTVIQQLWEPDLDYIYRQKKAQSIWDIWGEHLKLIAEENSINIYELTTNKEDQVKLLSKYEESIKNDSFSYSTSFKSQSLKETQKNLNSFRKINLKKMINLSLNRSILKETKNPLNQLNLLPNEFTATKSNNTHNFYNWSVSQFLSYQGKDTDLFIDLHPPQNFSSSTISLKYAYSVQQPIGSIVCQIFAGIFYKEISKNILVIGSQGNEKSFLIQAIAGETELKIITDSAHRYAMVYRGVAVGIKLLKDVFEALSVHTPCIFLLEDIHAIGERRPFLIDESTPNESTYNKNKSMQALFSKEKSSSSREGVYKTSKHLLSHYKKPYKETRGLATNHFSFTFLFGDVSNKIRNNELKLSSGLAIQVIKKENELTYKSSSVNSNNRKVSLSSLLINHSTGENLAPPASSPFSVLLLKEATKLKHKKTVKEIPWFGLPGEQYSLVSKYNYSIRIKVALLADLVLSNLSVKLDMITDLLVIIDSVKSNRGFVVFATTHVPYLLDPALRRPGRFDETISLPIIPSLYSRLINYRSNFHYLNESLFTKYSIPFNGSLSKGSSFDLNKLNLFDSPFNNVKTTQMTINQLVNYIHLKNLNLPILGKIQTVMNSQQLNLFETVNTTNNKLLAFYSSRLNLPGCTLTNSILSYSLALKNFKRSMINDYSMNKATGLNYKQLRSANKETGSVDEFSPSAINHSTKMTKRSIVTTKKFLQLRSRHYSDVCKSIVLLMLFHDNDFQKNMESPLNSSLKWPNILKDLHVVLNDYSNYLTLFNSDKFLFKVILMSLMAGKLGESFAITATSSSISQMPLGLESQQRSNKASKSGFSEINESFLFSFDKTWKYSSSLLFSYLQKRQCSALNKNLSFFANQLLSVNNKYYLMEPPSPPISNILLPTKRYENYKRTFNQQYLSMSSEHTFTGSISEKLQFHQKQRLLKRLYKYPIKEFYRSHLLKGDNSTSNSSSSNFNNSYLILGPLEKTNLASVNKPSSINWCYRNILYNRHKTYLVNQWWNGQQGEHNSETTFLSDIDWRYTFVPTIGDIQIDFPDAEQFYNPRNRRWINTKGDWTHWSNTQVELNDVYSHYAYECFTKTYSYLNKNREVIDFYAEYLHQGPVDTNLKERIILSLYKRFLSH